VNTPRLTHSHLTTYLHDCTRAGRQRIPLHYYSWRDYDK